MHPEIKVWLKDIQLSINEIHEFLPPPRNYILFQKDLKTRKAVERNIDPSALCLPPSVQM